MLLLVVVVVAAAAATIVNIFRLIIIVVCDAIVDLAFLIDGSTAVGMKNFKKSIAFALRVIKNFAVSKLGTHVSVVVFSNQPHVIFDLQAYYNHASLEKAMQNIAYPKIKNPKITYTKLGSGLRVVKTSVFKDSGRLNIPKMLFVMSSSTSADNVKIPALRLRSTGVVIYALGMGSAFSPTQLKTIATYSPIEHVVATRFAYLDCLEPWLARHLCSGELHELTFHEISHEIQILALIQAVYIFFNVNFDVIYTFSLTSISTSFIHFL